MPHDPDVSLRRRYRRFGAVERVDVVVEATQLASGLREERLVEDVVVDRGLTRRE